MAALSIIAEPVAMGSLLPSNVSGQPSPAAKRLLSLIDEAEEDMPSCAVCSRHANPAVRGGHLVDFGLTVRVKGKRGPWKRVGTIKLCQKCWRELQG